MGLGFVDTIYINGKMGRWEDGISISVTIEYGLPHTSKRAAVCVSVLKCAGAGAGAEAGLGSVSGFWFLRESR